jgi:hypothetical protein
LSNGGTVAVLDIGFMHEEFERAAVRIDHGVPLAPHALLAGIVAARSTGFGRLHALAVDHRGGRRRLAVEPHPVELH